MHISVVIVGLESEKSDWCYQIDGCRVLWVHARRSCRLSLCLAGRTVRPVGILYTVWTGSVSVALDLATRCSRLYSTARHSTLLLSLGSRVVFYPRDIQPPLQHCSLVAAQLIVFLSRVAAVQSELNVIQYTENCSTKREQHWAGMNGRRGWTQPQRDSGRVYSARVYYQT